MDETNNSGIDKASKAIRKKLTLQDYKTETQQNVKTAKRKKVKVTVYLHSVAAMKFNRICANQILTSGKPDKSQLICEAIDLLYEKKIS